MYRMLLAALLALGLVADARAGIITPTGLQPGDQFRVVFVTTSTTPAASMDISYYDGIVAGDATAAGLGTYNGSPVTWEVIGSTFAVSAVSRLPTDNVPIFLPDGTEVAASGSALWDTPDTPLLNPIDETASGTLATTATVWTGTDVYGTNSGNPLGGFSTTSGESFQTIDLWIQYTAQERNFVADPIYGFSSVLTVPTPPPPAVPEPASITLALAGIGGLVGARLARRRQRASRSGKSPPAPS